MRIITLNEDEFNSFAQKHKYERTSHFKCFIHTSMQSQMEFCEWDVALSNNICKGT